MCLSSFDIFFPQPQLIDRKCWEGFIMMVVGYIYVCVCVYLLKWKCSHQRDKTCLFHLIFTTGLSYHSHRHRTHHYTVSWILRCCLHFHLVRWKHFFFHSDWLAKLSVQGLSVCDSQPWILNTISGRTRRIEKLQHCDKIIVWSKPEVEIWWGEHHDVNSWSVCCTWLIYLKLIRSNTFDILRFKTELTQFSVSSDGSSACCDCSHTLNTDWLYL